ncbi:hypothetical protein Tco_0633006 [Tanacetum coccineum]
MHKKFQMSSMGKLTFLGLQVTQKDDGIFISQDKYVDEILKTFGFLTVKTASTSMETSKSFLKDAEAEDVDVHLYRSMIGSSMYITSSRPDIMFDILERLPKLGLWYPKDSPFNLEAYTNSDYAGASLDRKSTIGVLPGIKLMLLGQVSAARLPLEIQLLRVSFVNLMERAVTTASSLEAEQDSGNINRTQSMATLNESFPQGTNSGSGPRCQDTILGGAEAQIRFEAASKQSNDLTLSRINTLVSGEDNMKLKELMDICAKLSDRVLALENTNTSQAAEIATLKERVMKLEKKRRSRTYKPRRLYKVGLSRRIASSDDASLGAQEDASKQGRKIADLDVDTEVTLIDKTQGRNDEDLMFDTGVLNGDEVFQELASQLPQVKDKGKAKMVEPEKPLKNKDHIATDEEVSRNLEAQLQAELEEEERLSR